MWKVAVTKFFVNAEAILDELAHAIPAMRSLPVKSMAVAVLQSLLGWIRAAFEKNNWEYVSKEAFEALVKGLEAL